MSLDFVVVDLFDQYAAVKCYTEGWSGEQILDWLRQFGRVEHTLYESIGVTHMFRSVCGLETPFVLSQEGDLIIPNFVGHIRADMGSPYTVSD